MSRRSGIRCETLSQLSSADRAPVTGWSGYSRWTKARREEEQDAMITFEHVSKTYPGGVEAVKDLSLEVEKGETLVLLGTSGSGKTTSMKMVNRLIEPTEGRILVNGNDIMGQDPIELRRRIGYAIQHIGLFPHMTVGENIGVVPRLLKWDDAKITDRVDTMLNMVGLDPEDFRDRFPNQLSGGQKQRIGVARSLAADPEIILMDEPFGALDPITREELQNEFLELESEIRKTILFVTHDVFEAVKMGDRIALLDDGRLQQIATPGELVENPANEFVDRFLGQHRFQLSLLTTTVRGIIESCKVEQEARGTPPDRPPDNRLRFSNSLIEALDVFKQTGAAELPVYRGNQYKGSLSQKTLLNAMTRVLGEAGADT